MNRGDIVVISAPGDYGKPRPAVIVQSDIMRDGDSVLVALLTTDLRNAPLYRLTLDPTPGNSLERRSQIMADKIIAMPRAKCGHVIGRADDVSMRMLTRMLVVIFAIAE